MSFGLHLHTCNLGTTARQATNPFTGEPVEFPIDVGLSDSETDAVEAFLADNGASEPDPDSYCRVELSGDVVNVAVGGLYDAEPCVAFAIECSDLNQTVAQFVHELACRGNMSIGSSIDPTVVSLPLSGQVKDVSERWPSFVLVDTPTKLLHWLQKNVQEGNIV